MGLPDVGQLSFLGNVFKESIAKYDNRSLAYLGCATGNGLDYIDIQKTKQITVIDINPEYLEILISRYQSKIPNLEIIEADLSNYEGNNKKYSLIFAGLLFEYVSPRPLLIKVAKWLDKKGVMVVVLQLHEQNTKKVSDSPYSSLKLLDSIMNLVSDQDFKLMARESGMSEIEGKRVTLESGKSFYIGTYEKIA
jgi:phospholipid N-methyltransferase